MGGNDKRKTTQTQTSTSQDNRQDNSINGSTVAGGDIFSVDDYKDDDSINLSDVVFDSSDRSVRATDNSDRSVRATDNSDRSVRATDNSDRRVDNSRLDASDRSVRATDNSDRSVRSAIDNSVEATDASDRRVDNSRLDASDRSVRATDNSRRSTVTTTKIDRRSFSTVTDGGAIQGNIDVSLAALNNADRLGDLAYSFALDAQDGSYEMVSDIIRETAEANAKGDAATASVFGRVIDATRSEGADTLNRIILAGAAVAALAFMTR